MSTIPTTDEEQDANGTCGDCGRRETAHVVQCPVDEDRRLELCTECHQERGPGIEIYHIRQDSEWEVDATRAEPQINGLDERHMNNTAFPTPGWLGNPHPMEEDSEVERWRVLKAFKEDLLRKAREDEFFPYHLGKVRGKRVACRCRSESEDWPDDGDPCHLDVVNAALFGLYRND